MIRIEEVVLNIDHQRNCIKRSISSILGIEESELIEYSIAKRAVDSRNKKKISFVYSVDAVLKDGSSCLSKIGKKLINRHRIRLYEPYEYIIKKIKRDTSTKRPVVIGTGPAGLFCALIMAKAGLAPLVVERGWDVDSRIKDVEKFFNSGELNTESNVQFGEGGAGTFSDGKLNTLIKNSRTKYIFDQFISHGAPDNIAWDAKPHIGTDKLRAVVKNIRKEIVKLGGEVLFETCLTDIEVENGKISSAVLNGDKKVFTDDLILATGHSARDTYEMLYQRGVKIQSKPFSIGVRIEHKAEQINKSRYHSFFNSPKLPTASYKLVAHPKGKRAVYTFCMCPGGYVVAASSENGRLVVNGMSENAQDGENSNCALLVNVNADDFGAEHPLAGIEFQRKWEAKAFEQGGSDFFAPAQYLGDFLGTQRNNSGIEVQPSYRPGVRFKEIKDCLPDYVIESIKAALPLMGNKIKGFDSPNAVITGIETRSSSPVKFFRDEKLESNIQGLYPSGEGAGYAGGIVSSAVDGLRTGEAVIEKYLQTDRRRVISEKNYPAS